MINSTLEKLKLYIAERHEELTERFNTTQSDYSNGRLDAMDEIFNYLVGEEIYSHRK